MTQRKSHFFRVKVVSYRNHCSVKAAFPIRIQTELIVSWLHLRGDASCYVVKCLDTLTCLLTASDARGLSQDFMLRNKSGNAWNDSWLPGLCTGLCPCPDFCFPVPMLNILKVTLEYVGASQNPGTEISLGLRKALDPGSWKPSGLSTFHLCLSTFFLKPSQPLGSRVRCIIFNRSQNVHLIGLVIDKRLIFLPPSLLFFQF